MSKSIDNLIEKRVKTALEKDTLTDDDLKFLFLYKSMNKKSSLEQLIGGVKKAISFLNTPDNEGDE